MLDCGMVLWVCPTQSSLASGSTPLHKIFLHAESALVQSYLLAIAAVIVEASKQEFS